MYRHFFHLDKLPFSLTADPRLLFLTPEYCEALATLSFVILARKGLAVLISDAGMGKTTLLATLRQELPAADVQIGAILNPLLSPAEFLEMTLIEFGRTNIPASKAQRVNLFRQALLRNHAAGKISVLLVDEAQKLTPEVLEEIRLLSNFEDPEEKLLQIVLAGQKELEEMLDRAALWQLKQRVSFWISLQPLTSVEVQEYIQHRWTRAGGKERHPFEPDALSGIADISGGIPRLINSICETSLILAFADAKRQVSLRHVMDACSNLRLHTGANAKALPLAPRPSAEQVPGTTACPAVSSSATPLVQRQAPVVRPPRTLKRQQAAGNDRSFWATIFQRLTNRHSVREVYDTSSLTPSADHSES
jgi:type II secretory pathway predicted ATPase ExeA